MEELENLIRGRIQREGRITFEAFMEMALYEPGLGYYASPGAEVGRAGDFFTSPHLHPIFGAMLGLQAEEMWEALGEPRDFRLIEAGPGRGWLARDILDYLKGRELYKSLSYTLVELNPHMRKRQRELLAGHAGKVGWASSLGEIKDAAGLILTNELLDALPVHLVQMEDSLKEIYVALEGEKLVEEPGPPSDPSLESYFEEFGIHLPAGYRTEVNLRMKRWLSEAASTLGEGFLLTIDYGYPARDLYAPERDRGTLMCYRGHEVNEEPLERAGRQDITTHVNFSALKRWGEELGLRGIGFARQGPYLVSLGIDAMIAELAERSPDYAREISKVKGLIMPGGMGDTHKVLVQYRGSGSPSLRGFAMKNQIGAL
ncbi:MAG: SAM-dependent methyltransferase [Nitrospirota bacterium]|jgi:SAM-dependent MidA family methyltransferase